MWCDIWNNILANFIYSLVIFVFTFLAYLLLNHRKLLKFFGIERTKRLVIFTSNLQIVRNGSKGKKGQTYSFQGTAIPNEESKAASRLQTLFNYFLPSQGEKPGLISKILISDVDVKIYPSPKEFEIFEQSASIISLGLPAYNSISQYIEENFELKAKSSYQQRSILNIDNDYLTTSTAYSYEVTSPSTVHETENNDECLKIPVIKTDKNSSFTKTSIGFIQKVVDDENQRSIFFIAGLSENSTAGCVFFLVSKWKELNKKYGCKQPFYIILRVSRSNNHEWQILEEGLNISNSHSK